MISVYPARILAQLPDNAKPRVLDCIFIRCDIVRDRINGIPNVATLQHRTLALLFAVYFHHELDVQQAEWLNGPGADSNYIVISFIVT